VNDRPGKPEKINIDHIVNAEGESPSSGDDGVIEIVEDAAGTEDNSAEMPAEQARGESDPGADAIEELLNDALREKEELREMYLRSCADLENFRKRVERDSEEQRARAAISVVRELLTPLDNLQLAVEQAKDQPSIQEGLSLILRQMEEALAKVGVEPIEALGEQFNPSLHEAMTVEPREGFAPNTIIEEIRKGYALGGRVIRPSLVKVVIAGPAETQGDGGGQGDADG